MHEDVLDALLLRHFQERIQVGELGMHAPVAAEAHQMEPAAAWRIRAARMLHRGQQDGVGEEFPIGDHDVDARHIHMDHAPRAHVQVPHLAVAHLAFG
jgi:hypothetical protein